MNKKMLEQYDQMKKEMKDVKRRIGKLEREIQSLEIVADSVKGTRKDGTMGQIRITGFPYPEYRRKKIQLVSGKRKMEKLELELSKKIEKIEEWIEQLENSELRTLFRFYYLDNLPWFQVALRMNGLFPKRRIKYTEDSCRKRNARYFEKE